MAIELLLSAAVIVVFGGMILAEWLLLPDPKDQRPVGWRAAIRRADLLLGGCIFLCLGVIWLPLFFR
jgi:hypothetical protein